MTTGEGPVDRNAEPASGQLKAYLTDRAGNREGVWLRLTTDNQGEIANLPVLVCRYKFGDEVIYEPASLQVLRIVRDGGYTRTRVVKYEGDSRLAIQEWVNKGYMVEHLTPGRLGVARKRRS